MRTTFPSLAASAAVLLAVTTGCSNTTEDSFPPARTSPETSETAEGNSKGNSNKPAVPPGQAKKADSKRKKPSNAATWKSNYMVNRTVIDRTLSKTGGLGEKKVTANNSQRFVQSCRSIQKKMKKTGPENGSAALIGSIQKPVQRVWNLNEGNRRGVSAVFGSSIQYVCPELLIMYRDYVS